jgi:hypothetical protein
MNLKVFFVLLALSLMAGCSATFRLYPVQGPLSAQTPLPVFSGKVTGVLNSGNVSFALRNGEVCKGLWTRVVPVKAVNGTIANPPSSGMSSVWDTVYGSGYYVSHVLGAKLYAQAAITGSRGTVLSVEFYRPNPGSEQVHLFGVARDSKDNIYNITRRAACR